MSSISRPMSLPIKPMRNVTSANAEAVPLTEPAEKSSRGNIGHTRGFALLGMSVPLCWCQTPDRSRSSSEPFVHFQPVLVATDESETSHGFEPHQCKWNVRFNCISMRQSVAEYEVRLLDDLLADQLHRVLARMWLEMYA